MAHHGFQVQLVVALVYLPRDFLARELLISKEARDYAQVYKLAFRHLPADLRSKAHAVDPILILFCAELMLLGSKAAFGG